MIEQAEDRMTIRAGAHSMFQKLLAKARAYAVDRRGVAAIEFAFMVPLLLSLYLVTMEISQAIETNKKISRLGSMTADLVTQMPAVTTSDIDGIMAIGDAILQPYGRSKPKIFVTAIEITNDATPRTQVVWSRKLVNGTPAADLTKGTQVTIPAALRIPGTFLIRVEGALDYKPVIAWKADSSLIPGLSSIAKGISMSETYYLRPRMSSTIPCDKDCK